MAHPKTHTLPSLKSRKRSFRKQGTGPRRCVYTNPHKHTTSYTRPRASKENEQNTPTQLQGPEKLVRTYAKKRKMGKAWWWNWRTSEKCQLEGQAIGVVLQSVPWRYVSSAEGSQTVGGVTYIHTHFRVAIKKTRKPPKKTVGPTEDIQDMQPYKYSRTYKAPRSKYVRMQARKWEKHDDETGRHQKSASCRAKPSAWCYKLYCKDT